MVSARKPKYSFWYWLSVHCSGHDLIVQPQARKTRVITLYCRQLLRSLITLHKQIQRGHATGLFHRPIECDATNIESRNCEESCINIFGGPLIQLFRSDTWVTFRSEEWSDCFRQPVPSFLRFLFPTPRKVCDYFGDWAQVSR
jgi:hypothetical protein